MQRLFRWSRRAALVAFTGWLTLSVGLIIAIYLYGQRDDARPANVIIVLGAGVEADGSPSQTLLTRVQRGGELWQQGIAPLLICTGGVVGAAPTDEASVCRDILLGMGVPPDAILSESQSINTQQNAIYATQLMQQQNLQTAVVVSSRYHVLRARWLFARQGLHVHTSPSPIGHLTRSEIFYSYVREWGAFHYQILRDLLPVPHVYVPVP